MKQSEAHTLHPAAGATSTIVTFANTLSYGYLSEEVRYYARRHLLDTVGVMIAGAPGDVATNAETMLAGVRQGGSIPVPGRAKRHEQHHVELTEQAAQGLRKGALVHDPHEGIRRLLL